MMFNNTWINRSSSKAKGFCKRGRGEIRWKLTISSHSEDIGVQKSLMGNGMFKYSNYIFRFSLSFTEYSYQIICVYQFDSFSHKLIDILWGLWCSAKPQPIGRFPKRSKSVCSLIVFNQTFMSMGRFGWYFNPRQKKQFWDEYVKWLFTYCSDTPHILFTYRIQTMWTVCR